MKCLETRTRTDGLKRRLYARQGLPNLTTLEVPMAALKAIGMQKVEAAIEKNRRGDLARVRAASVKAAVLERAGVKAESVAEELGICVSHVYKIRQEAKR
jgi:hypothetical protein